MHRNRLVRAIAAAVTLIALVFGATTPVFAAGSDLGDPGTFGGKVKLAPSGAAVGLDEATVSLEQYVGGARVAIPGAQSNTDSSGNYLISGLPDVPLFVTIVYNGTGPYQTKTIISNSVPSRVYNPTIAVACRFTGHVNISTDGSTPGGPAGANDVEVGLYSTNSSDPITTVNTDANGDYAFERVPRSQKVYVGFRYVGQDSFPRWFDTGDGIGTRDEADARKLFLTEDRVADVVIGAGPGIAGTVLDSQGEPVEGMTVRVFGYESTGNHEYVREYRPFVDASGHYIVRGIDPDLVYAVGWNAPGYAAGLNDGGDTYHHRGFVSPGDGSITTGVDGVLYREAVLQVNVRSAYPVRVTLLILDPVDEEWDEFVGGSEPDGLGNFEYGDLLPGKYAVRAAYDGSLGYNAIESRIFELDEGDTDSYLTGVYAPGDPNNVMAQYNAWGGDTSGLGTSQAGSSLPGGYVGVFENGNIYTSRYGTWAVWKGPIFDVYRASGGPQGSYGWPIGNQVCKAGLCTQTFQHGSISPGPMSPVTPPTVSGSFVVGGTVAASPGTYSPAATSWSYTWLRDGTEIPGAHGMKYVLTLSDFGRTLQVRVTGARIGSNPAASTSVATPTIEAGSLPVSPPVPRVSGTVSVGRVLTAVPGQWPTGTAITYQWLADDSPVAGATHATLSLPSDLIGTRITLAVTGAVTGYVPVTRVSAKTQVVFEASPARSASISGVISGAGIAQSEFADHAVTVELFSRSGTSYVPTGTMVVTGADGTYEFTDLLPGVYRVQVKYLGARGQATLRGAALTVHEAAARTFSTILRPFLRDLTSDRASDLVALSSSHLVVYSGSGHSSFAASNTLPGSWSSSGKFAIAGDLDGDDLVDVIVRKSSGAVLIYRGDGAGGWLGTIPVGTWSKITKILAPGDMDGDGNSDVLTRDTQGRMYLRLGDGAGGFAAPTKVAKGWASFKISPAGDFNADGYPDVIARTAAGTLFLYPGDGVGDFTARVKLATGWGKYNTIVGVGDFSGDGNPDILARTAAGSLWLFKGTDGGKLAPRVKVSTGWSSRTLIP